MRAGLAIVAAAVGGVAGYFLFFWVARQGFYALALPGLAMGLAASLAKCRSWVVAAGLGIAGTGLGIFTEWQWRPFIKDESFGYFLRNFSDLKPLTLILIAVGGLSAFWFARGRTPAAD